MRRLRWLIVVMLVTPVVVLAAEVLIARRAPRLDDETGFRPTGLVVRAGEDPSRVVWLGDSTSTGVGTAAVEESMAHRVTEAVTSGPATLTILGVSGAQVHEVVDDQLEPLIGQVGESGVDLIFVSVGANDVTGLTRRPTFRTRYARMVDAVRRIAPEAEIVLVGIPDMGTAPRLPVPLRQIAGVRAAQLDGVIADVAESRGLLHVDLAGRTSAIFSSDPDRYFAADGFHPSSEGHAVWAGAVVDAREAWTSEGHG